MLNATPEMMMLAQALVDPPLSSATAGVTVISEGVTLISRNGEHLEIRTGDQLATAQAATPVVESIATLNGTELTIAGTVNEDLLMIDVDQFVGSDPAGTNFEGTISFSAGRSANQDRLVLFDSNPATNDTFQSLDYRYFIGARESGRISAQSAVAPVSMEFLFSDLEFIDQQVETNRFEIVSSHRPDRFVVGNHPTLGLNQISTVIDDQAGPLMTVTNPHELFSIGSLQNDDEVIINSVDAGFRSAVNIEGQEGNDNIVIGGALTLGHGSVTGNLDLQAETITIQGSVDTTGGNPDGSVVFTGNSVVRVTGSINSGSGDVIVADGSSLSGGGLIASNVVVQSNATLGSISANSLHLHNGSLFSTRLNGPLPGTDFDQVVINPSDAVDGAVTIDDGALLDLSLGFTPTDNTEFVLINNDGNDVINGRFRTLIDTDGSMLLDARTLDEGDVVLDTTSGIPRAAYITYFGGDGNDVAIVTAGDLTVQSQGATLISRNGTNLEIRVGDSLAAAQAASPMVRPIAGLNEHQLIVNGAAANDDLLYVDFDQFIDTDPSGINFTGQILFAGGAAAADQDRLVMFDSNPTTDDAFDSLAYRFFIAARQAGEVTATSAIPTSFQLRFLEVELIDQLIDTNRLDLLASHRPDRFVVDDDPSAGLNLVHTIIDDQPGPTLSVTNPRESLSIASAQSTDHITINGVDAGFDAAITLDGQAGNDRIVIGGTLSLGGGGLTGDVDLRAESIQIPGVINTTGGMVDGTVRFADGSVANVSGSINTGNSDVVVSAGSRLEGDGRIESNVIVQADGLIAPGTTGSAVGNPTASLQVGSIQLQDGSVYAVQLNGPEAGIDYDQIVIKATAAADGTAMIDGALLDFTLGFAPGQGTEFVLIDNDQTDVINGRLRTLIGVDGSLLPAARTLSEGDLVFDTTSGPSEAAYITYFGGDGNDVAIVMGGDVTIESQGVTLISRNGSNLEIRVGATLAAAQAAGPTVRPIAGLNGNDLTINGIADSNDELYVDVDRFIDPQGINFDGTIVFAGNEGTGDQDRLIVFDSDLSTNDNAETITYTSLAVPESGSMAINPFGSSPDIVIAYSGTELLDQLIDANHIDLTLSTRAETLLIDQVAGSPNRNQIQTFLETTPGTLFTIPNPEQLFSISSGSGNDSVAINGLSSSFSAAIDINSASGLDSIVVNTPLSLGSVNVTGDLDLRAASVQILQSIDTTGGLTAGTVTIDGGNQVVVSAAVSTGNAPISIDGNDGTIDTASGTLQSLNSIVIRDATDIVLGNVDIAGATLTLGVDRDITGAVTQAAGTSVVASRLTASTNGSIDLPEPANRFDAVDGISADGRVSIADGDGDLQLFGVDSGGNDIIISTVGSAILQTVIQSPGATVQINAGQAIVDFAPADTSAKITADRVILTAGSGGIGQTGALEIDADVLSIDTSAGNGSVHVTNPFGSLRIDQVSAGSGVVKLSANQLDDATDDTLSDFTASRLELTAMTGIGSVRPLELTSVQRLSAQTDSGGINLDWTATGNTVVESLVAGSGGIALTQRGGSTLDIEVLENQSGLVNIISEDGSIDIASGPQISAETIRIEADRDLSIDRSIRTTAGALNLFSNETITLAGDLDTTAATVNGAVSISSPSIIFQRRKFGQRGRRHDR